MKLENDYPLIYKKTNRFLFIRKVIILTFLIGLFVSVLINIIVGGKLWCLYILGGELIFYFSFLHRPLIDNSLIKKITLLLLIIIFYLYSIDLINTTNWSYLVINILSFSFLIFEFFFFFINYEQHKNKVILMFLTSLFSMFFCLLGIVNIITINWALIVTGSVGLFNFIMLFTIYFKTTILELKKYFSLR